MQPPRSRVAIQHRRENDLSDEDVHEMARGAVELLGGMERYVRRHDTVLLKPNQTLWMLATDGVTTDPRLVAAMVRLCKEAGAARVVVGDSCGGDLKTRRVMEVTGVKRYAEAAGADVVAFEEEPQDPVRIQADGEQIDIKVPRIVLEAQAIVNLPKAKTHFEDVVSCCIKNWVGLPYQKERPRLMQDPLLAKAAAALHQRIPARLHVVDGLWAGEGNGPAANDATWLGCVVAGEDPVAVDATVARLMGLPAEELVFAREAERLGLGTRDEARIELAGARLEEARIRARPTKPGFGHIEKIRVLQGEGVTFAGSLGHLKSIADVFLKYGFWDAIEATYGKPTFMVGRIEDPDFERHVEEGPYFVIDDAAHERYKKDPRVTFVPGHPATHNIFPHLFQRLHVEHVGPAGLKLASITKQVEGWFHFTSWQGEKPRERETRA